MEGQEPTLIDYLTVLGLSLPLSLLSLYLGKRFSYFTPHVYDKPLALRFKTLVGAFLLFLGLVVVVFPLLYLIFGKAEVQNAVREGSSEVHTVINAWVNIGLMMTSALMFVGYLRFLGKEVRRAVLGANGVLGLRQMLRDFFYGILTLPICYPIVLSVSQILGILVLLFFTGPRGDQVAVLLLKTSQSSLWLFSSMLLTIILIVPFIEELLFRGFLQVWLIGKVGTNLAIILTSLIFALFHYSSSQGVYNVEIIGSLFVLSCFLGYNVLRFKSLWASIGLHAFFNFTSVLMILNDASRGSS